MMLQVQVTLDITTSITDGLLNIGIYRIPAMLLKSKPLLF
jgi:hypothetical protein